MHGGGQPSCFDRVKMGFMMGMCVGMASGGILGGFGALRMGMRGREHIDPLSVHTCQHLTDANKEAVAITHMCMFFFLQGVS